MTARSTKSAPKRSRKDNAAERRIVDSARRHFFAHGFRGVTMDDLAGELGMSKKTLYACFPSKTDLLRAVVVDKFRAVEVDLERIAAGFSKDGLASLHRLLACLQQHTEEIQPPFVRDIRREAPEIFELVQKRRRQVIQRYFGKLFDECRRAGVVRKDISTRLIIEVLLGAAEAVMNPAKMAELNLTLQAGFSTVTAVVLEGVLTERARAR